MKWKKVTMLFFLIIMVLFSIKYFFLGTSIIKIGTIRFSKKENTYINIYHEDKLASFHRLLFDYYYQGHLIISKQKFNYTDSYPDLKEFKVMKCGDYYYLTYHNDNEANVIWNESMNVVFPVNWLLVIDEDSKKLQLKLIKSELRKCKKKIMLRNE